MNLKFPFWTSEKSLFIQPKDKTYLFVFLFLVWYISFSCLKLYNTFTWVKQDLWTENFFINLFIITGLLWDMCRKEISFLLGL